MRAVITVTVSPSDAKFSTYRVSLKSEQHIDELEILRARIHGGLLPRWKSPETSQKDLCTTNDLVTKFHPCIFNLRAIKMYFDKSQSPCHTNVRKCNEFVVHKCDKIWSDISCQSTLYVNVNILYTKDLTLFSFSSYISSHISGEVGGVCQLSKHVLQSYDTWRNGNISCFCRCSQYILATVKVILKVASC